MKAVSQALHVLGTGVPANGDEFGAVGLDERRYTEEWVVDQEVWDSKQEAWRKNQGQDRIKPLQKPWWRWW